jgi:hypothetical protein
MDDFKEELSDEFSSLLNLFGGGRAGQHSSVGLK